MSDGAPALRVSDADRERVAERLRRAAGEGRLGPEELEQRLEAAFGARTQGELTPLVADLPVEHPVRARPRRRRDLHAFAATSVLLVVIWALADAGYFWPAWPILGWGLFAIGPATPAPLAGTLRPCRRNASSRPSTTR